MDSLRVGYNALHRAIMSFKHEEAERLLDGGARPDVPTSAGVLPLELAVRYHLPSVVTKLRRLGMNASAQYSGYSLLEFTKSPDMVTALLEPIEGSPIVELRTPIRGKSVLEYFKKDIAPHALVHIAGGRESLEIINMLARAGAPVNSVMLRYGIEVGSREILDRAIADASPALNELIITPDGNFTPIQYTIYLAYPALFDILLAAAPTVDINREGTFDTLTVCLHNIGPYRRRRAYLARDFDEHYLIATLSSPHFDIYTARKGYKPLHRLVSHEVDAGRWPYLLTAVDIVLRRIVAENRADALASGNPDETLSDIAFGNGHLWESRAIQQAENDLNPPNNNNDLRTVNSGTLENIEARFHYATHGVNGTFV